MTRTLARVHRASQRYQRKFKGPRKRVKQLMRQFDCTLETEVWIWWDGDARWTGAVGAHGRVWIFRGDRSRTWLADIQPYSGFFPSGALIIDHWRAANNGRDIRAEMEALVERRKS